MAQLEVQMEMNRAEYEKAKQLDENQGNEIKRRLESEMNELHIKEERARLEAEKKTKEAELEEKKKMANLKVDFEEQERKQTLKHDNEEKELDLTLKKSSHVFQQQLATERVEMEKKFKDRTQAVIDLQTKTGSSAKIQLTGEISDSLSSFLTNFTQGGVLTQQQQQPAINAPPAAQEVSSPNDSESTEPQTKASS